MSSRERGYPGLRLWPQTLPKSRSLVPCGGVSPMPLGTGRGKGLAQPCRPWRGSGSKCGCWGPRLAPLRWPQLLVACCPAIPAQRAPGLPRSVTSQLPHGQGITQSRLTPCWWHRSRRRSDQPAPNASSFAPQDRGVSQPLAGRAAGRYISFNFTQEKHRLIPAPNLPPQLLLPK